MTMPLSDFNHAELTALHEEQASAYDALLAKGLKLDLTRGKPSPEQLLARIRSRTPVGGPPAADLIRSERDQR